MPSIESSSDGGTDESKIREDSERSNDESGQGIHFMFRCVHA
jgi:hypothetical protein